MAHDLENKVARHYARGDLERAILDALVAAGKDPEHLTPGDLAPVDEFHTGGRQATIDLAVQMEVAPGMHLLDIGCGLGGASRFFAEQYGCRVTGIDLTEDYVRTAEALARRVGLAGRVSYRQASALALSFAPGAFDGAYMMHVGMNVEDKRALFAEARRVVKAGGVFAVYDVVRTGAGEPRYPLHWAANAETSFLADADEYRDALEAGGFEVRKARDRRDFALDFFRRARARAAAGPGPPPLGLHILMKTDVAQKLANAIDSLERGVLAPSEFVCRAR